MSEGPILVMKKEWEDLPVLEQAKKIKEAITKMLEHWYNKSFAPDSEWIIIATRKIRQEPEPEKYEEPILMLAQYGTPLCVPVLKSVLYKHYLIVLQEMQIPENFASTYPPNVLARNFCIDAFPIDWEAIKKQPKIYPEIIDE